MINPFSLESKNILLTGASSGIGKETAILLSKLGASLTLVSRTESKLIEVLESLEQGNHSYCICDLADLDAIEIMFSQCVKKQKYDGMVHSAGVSFTLPLRSNKIGDLIRVTNTNYLSFMELAKHFCKSKNHNKGASVIAISSVASLIGEKGHAAYCASKGALNSAIRALAIEFAEKPIRFNSIAPGFINTDMYRKLENVVDIEKFNETLKEKQPLGMGEPLDVAYAVAYLLSDASKFVTGATLVVDGGYTAQ